MFKFCDSNAKRDSEQNPKQITGSNCTSRGQSFDGRFDASDARADVM